MMGLSLAFSFCALGLLCLAMPRHHEQVFGRKPGRSAALVLRVSGWMVLAGALNLAIMALGASIGLALWVSWLSVVTLSLGLLLTYQPRLMMPALVVAPVIGLCWLVGA